MISGLFRFFFSSSSQKVLKKVQKKVIAINKLEEKICLLKDDQFKIETEKLKKRIKDGTPTDDLIEEAFALVREATKRVTGKRLYDVQIMGGIVLHYGMVAEMKTGEGKTLVATMPSYLNALSGNGVHIVTVNDYLAKRDSEEIGNIHEFLGLKTGCILSEMDEPAKIEAYKSDIIYATNHELGFDYLRDNMKRKPSEKLQRGFHYAIVDEVDSILIDEARTPLIISGTAEKPEKDYKRIGAIVAGLIEKEDFEKDEKSKNAILTESGVKKVETMMRNQRIIQSGGMFDYENLKYAHYVNQLLKAYFLYKKNADYIVRNKEVMIIDEFTGRVMDGRRYSDGLHQAIEAKENVPIQNENQTLASITYQNYFRMYEKLSGMTGTIMTEEEEISSIYKMRCIPIPTNKDFIRKDLDDEIYRTRSEKHEAIVALTKECYAKTQPVLIGTVTIKQSEDISKLLSKVKIPHNVLNAKFHKKESEIIAFAGKPGMVTIATNMAGRGTDIQLGGNLNMIIKDSIKGKDDKNHEQIITKTKAELEKEKQKVIDLGGLFIIGTERHESRRIDNQLRGRSGRQGDPGTSKFFISLEDDLMRIFGTQQLDKMLVTLGLKPGESLTHPWITKAIEKAQKKIEARNYDIRKHILKYDDIINEQRKIIYGQRDEIMDSTDLEEYIRDIMQIVVENIAINYIGDENYQDMWDKKVIEDKIQNVFGEKVKYEDFIKQDETKADVKAGFIKLFNEKYKSNKEYYGKDKWMSIIKPIILASLDECWKEHLLFIDQLEDGVNLRSYGQKDPLNEFKKEAFDLFNTMINVFYEKVVSNICLIEKNEEILKNLMIEEMIEDADSQEELLKSLAFFKKNADDIDNSEDSKKIKDKNEKIPLNFEDVKRNDLCPCGSGKKFKHCHGKIT